MLILASYIPPPYRSDVVTEGLAFIAQYPSIPAVWLGDFNHTMTPSLDRPVQDEPSRGEPLHTRLYRTLEDFDLIDAGRHANPTTRAYTCHSLSHNTMSRINYILVSRALLPYCPRLQDQDLLLGSYQITLRVG